MCIYDIGRQQFCGKSEQIHNNYQKRECLRKGNRSSVRLEEVLKEVSLARLNPTLTSKEES